MWYDGSMLNKVKVATLVVIAVVGMVLYKRAFDAREASKDAANRPNEQWH